jgi:hypothetical protein
MSGKGADMRQQDSKSVSDCDRPAVGCMLLHVGVVFHLGVVLPHVGFVLLTHVSIFLNRRGEGEGKVLTCVSMTTQLCMFAMEGRG